MTPPTHRSYDMTEKLSVRIEMMEAEMRPIFADFLRRGVLKEKREDAPSLAARRVRTALAAAPQPGPTHECPVCEETVTWGGPDRPYCGECAADNGWDVQMRSIAAAPQPAPADREALVEVIREASSEWSGYDLHGPSRSEAIADALLARGLRLPGVMSHKTASGDTQASSPITGDTQAERDAAFAAGQEEMRERAAEAVWGVGVTGNTTHSDMEDAIRALPIKPRS